MGKIIWDFERFAAFHISASVLVHRPASLDDLFLTCPFCSYRFLGAFAKLRKEAVSFVMSVRPSVRMEQLGSH